MTDAIHYSGPCPGAPASAAGLLPEVVVVVGGAGGGLLLPPGCTRTAAFLGTVLNHHFEPEQPASGCSKGIVFSSAPPGPVQLAARAKRFKVIACASDLWVCKAMPSHQT